jgi:hypothetical protein
MHYFLISIVLITLGLQLTLFVYLIVLARRHLNELQRCDPASLEALPGTTFPWLLWITHRLREAGNRREVVTLQLAVEEFEWSLAHDQYHLGLQRLGILAPIIGVLLTSILFLSFDSTKALKAEAILSSVTPLVAGVFAGAVLAILNQILLTIAGWQINYLRVAVRKWLDARQDVRRDLMDAAAASALLKGSEEAVLSLQQAAVRFEMSADQHIQQSASFQQAIRGIADASRGFEHRISDLGRELRSLEEIASGTKKFVDEATKHGSAAFGRLEEVSSLLHTSAAAKLVPAMETQSRFAEGLVNFMENTGALSHHMTRATEQLVTATQRHSEAWDKIGASWTARVEPAHELFQIRIQDLAAKSEELGSTMASLDNSFQTMGTRIDELQPQWNQQAQLLQVGAQTISRVLDDGLVPIVQAQERASIAWGEAAHRLNQSTGNLSSASDLALSASGEQAKAVKNWSALIESHVAPSLQALASAAQGLTEGSQELTQSVQTATGAISIAATSFSELPANSKAAINNLESAVSQFSNIITTDFKQLGMTYTATAAHTSEAVNSLRLSFASLAAASQDLRTAAAETTADVEQGLESRRVIAEAVDESRQSAAALRESIQQVVAPTHLAIRDTLSSLQQSINTLNAALENRLVPSTDALQQIIPIIHQLQKATQDLQPLSRLHTELHSLIRTTERLTDVIVAIEQLPDRIHSASQKNGNGRLWGRLFGRADN